MLYFFNIIHCLLYFYFALSLHYFPVISKSQFPITYDDRHYQCKSTKRPGFASDIRGVNIGGWLVLEPWITPSLFYQFLNTVEKYGPKKAPSKTAMDMYTFCKVLGPKEGNRQLRQHWKTFVTKEDIRQLRQRGVNSIRVPVGDWMFKPYPPYTGCTNGSISELNRIIGLAEMYNMTVLIDIHGHRYSQNGYDNSGQASAITWQITEKNAKFTHWTTRNAGWAGHYDMNTQQYISINYKNIYRSAHVVRIIASMYKNRRSILGISPLNEPFENIPINVLKKFYWLTYKIVKRVAPKWGVVIDFFSRIHDTNLWNTFMKGCPDVAIDAHIYQAWTQQIKNNQHYFWDDACRNKEIIKTWKRYLPVIIGEWSLATDNCVMWLNGFNDNLVGYPFVPCQYVNCPKGKLDKTRKLHGPFSTTGHSGPIYGKCPVTNGHVFDGLSQREMYGLLGRLKLDAFSAANGFYFWTFKTELDSKWSFLRATEKRYLPYNIANSKYKGLCNRYRK